MRVRESNAWWNYWKEHRDTLRVVSDDSSWKDIMTAERSKERKELGLVPGGLFAKWTTDREAFEADQESLEQVMRDCIQKHHGYITAGMFARASGLTLYSARKQLKEWTKGDCPKLMMTPRGKEHIYTEI